MKNTSHRNCPVCEQTQIEILHEMKFSLPDNSPLPKQYKIVSCCSCGMVYADSENSNQGHYDRYYTEYSKYEDIKTASGGGYSVFDEIRLDFTAEYLVSHINTTDRILDIGCANGGLLEALAKRGYQFLAGIDPSIMSVQHIQQRGFKGYAMKFSELLNSFSDVGCYDAVILSHVLEHVFDVKSAMSAIHSILVDRGIVYIEVPNAVRYVDYYNVPFYYFDPEHINHFSETSLMSLANNNAFEVVNGGEKEIVLSEQFSYPAIYAVIRKCAHNKKNIYCHELKKKIADYIQESHKDRKLDKIDRYYYTQQPLIVWGAGSYSQRLFATTKLAKCNIISIVDNDKRKQGLLINNILVESPEVLYRKIGTILISAAVYAHEIQADIKAMHLAHSIEVLN